VLLPFDVVRRVEYWNFIEIEREGIIESVRIPRYGSPTIGECSSPEFFTNVGIVSAALRRVETLPKFSEEEIPILIGKLTKLEFEACVGFMKNEVDEWNEDQKKDPESIEQIDQLTGAQSTSNSDISTQMNPDLVPPSFNIAQSESSPTR